MISWNEAISFESIECLYQCIVYIHYDIHYLLLKIYLVGLLRRFPIIKFLFRVAINNLKLERKKNIIRSYETFTMFTLIADVLEVIVIYYMYIQLGLV